MPASANLRVPPIPDAPRVVHNRDGLPIPLPIRIIEHSHDLNPDRSHRRQNEKPPEDFPSAQIRPHGHEEEYEERHNVRQVPRPEAHATPPFAVFRMEEINAQGARHQIRFPAPRVSLPCARGSPDRKKRPRDKYEQAPVGTREKPHGSAPPG